jgi:hypothetical protein
MPRERCAYVAAYEELRRQALTRSHAHSHSGLVLLLRKGIAAWMMNNAARRAPIRPSAGRPLVGTAMPNDVHAGVVQALASMALARRNEGSP